MEVLKSVNCNFCGEISNEFLFKGTDRRHRYVPSDVWCDVVRCSNCGLIYLSPRVREEFISDFYPAEEYYTKTHSEDVGRLSVLKDDLFCAIAFKYFGYPESNISFKTNVNRLTLSICVPLVFRLFTSRFRQCILSYVSGGSLLEFGFGAGDFLIKSKNLGWECWGVERDDEAIARMRRLGINTYSNLWAPEIPTNYFDWVKTYHSLEHVYDPKSFLHRFYEIIKPGGKIFVGVPNFDSFVGRVFGTYWDNLGVPIHTYIFTTATAIMYLKEAGFTDITVRHSSIPQGLLGSMQYLVNDLISRFTGKKYNGMFLRDTRLCQILATPISKLLDFLKLGDAIELVASKR